ncbi:NADPH:quinone oxidoreductase [Deinococcus piscis]|uniref:NADPH:quinone oxidoreductase n=1 Tax=Deinococcus piscis TaxID=394230 RepID=A0ABQ3JZN8_9DEIO|nr:NADP-dependent oxidoreductase [Deinococcus piscis]GHF97220.1 NADPH:quinone oxidoreductase [Deinococcus piscis]
MNKAFYISKYGGPEVMEWGEFPPAPLGPKDVRIQIHAASVNPLDWRIRSGALKVILPYTFPLILGNDCSGVVSEVGREVTRFKVGDAVYSRVQDDRIGTFAQEIVTAEAAVAHKPTNLTHAEAASLPMVLLTAHQVLTEAAPLRAGQSVLIHGGAGAVGSMAIQVARHLGLRVATTVSGKDTDFVKGLGAETVVDYRTQKFEDVVRGMDAVLDGIGMENLLRSFQTVNPGATVVSISDGPDVQTAKSRGLSPLLWPVFMALSAKPNAAARKAQAHYRYWFMHTDGGRLESLTPLLENGTLRPHLDRIFPFEQTAQALAYAESGKAKGKVVIQMRDE